MHLEEFVDQRIAERFAELRKTGVKTVMITGDYRLTVGTARSFTVFLPSRPARSPRGYRGMGDDPAMTGPFPARTISSPGQAIRG